ncbi:MAG TPA: hypothetical protein VM095_15190 [Pyrinomonadaceae bacterium]|nr:hypothetical protein [Pyrinomonadaceae bacterium]
MKSTTKIHLRISLVALALVLCAAARLLYATGSFSNGLSSGLDYFKGSWVVRIRSDPKQIYKWTVREDQKGKWMTGVIEKDGERVSTDFWRVNDDRIERFAFTANGAFVRIEGGGWESNKLILTGITSGQAGETKIRETITRVNEREFHALWERENADGKWTTFSDEVCTR